MSAKHFTSARCNNTNLARKGSAFWPWAYLVFVFTILSLPLVGMLFLETETLSSLGEPAASPQLFTTDGLNLHVLSDMGAYIEDHYAFKSHLIDTDAHLRNFLFGVSNTKQVVIGGDGWLYYGGTLNDYLGKNPVSERMLDNIAYNLRLAQGYVQNRGARMLVTFAPNKNTIYPEHMPGNYRASAANHDIERVLPYLDERGVNYVNLVSVLRDVSQTNLVYCLRDSHWNELGALIARDALLDAVGIEHTAVYDYEGFEPVGSVGDIDAMLYPVSAALEYVPEYSGSYNMSFVGTTDVTANVVETTGSGSERLLMFRDSFGNRLLAPMAEAFAYAYFTNLVPYDFSRVDSTQADVVIIERVERHLNDLATNPPVFPSPTVNIQVSSQVDTQTSMHSHIDGGYIVIDGTIDKSAIESHLIDADTNIYVSLEMADETRTYVAFHISLDDGSGRCDYGYRIFVARDSLPANITSVRIYAESKDQLVCVLEGLPDKEGIPS